MVKLAGEPGLVLLPNAFEGFYIEVVGYYLFNREVGVEELPNQRFELG